MCGLGGVDRLSFYIDVIKYHANHDALKNSENWECIDNIRMCPNKGWEWMQGHRIVSEPTDFETSEKANLPDGTQKVLYDMLNFCTQEKIEVLFTVSPYVITLEDQMMYNSIQEVTEQYGFRFLNANEYYEDMRIDFSVDFTDINHVNCFGAEKYTDFLEKYIKAHYDVSDHRKDKAYESWNEEFLSYSEEERHIKKAIYKQIERKKEGAELGVVLSKTTDIWQWSSLLNNPNYTIICAEKGCFEVKDLLSDKIIQNIGLSEQALLGKEHEFVGIIKDLELFYSNVGTEEEYFVGTIGDNGNGWNAKLEIGLNVKGSIMIDDLEYGKQQNGLNIIVFDHNYNCVVDSVVLTYDTSGKLQLVR